jgi:hypothetical protein
VPPASGPSFLVRGGGTDVGRITAIVNRDRGPAKPSINDEAGLLVDGYDTPSIFITTHNALW